MPKIIFLWTDIALFALLLVVLAYAWHVSRSPALRATWARVARNTPAMCSAVVLFVFVVIGLLDSLHYQPRLPPVAGAPAGVLDRASRSPSFYAQKKGHNRIVDFLNNRIGN